jgi:hypothetical protein
MKKLLLVLIPCLFSVALFAQDNVFFHESDTASDRDTIPLFTRASFGFYFTPAITSNVGTHVPPPADVVGFNPYYSGAAQESPSFGFSFGVTRESKPFAKRLFYSIGLEFADFKYTGNATLVYTNTTTLDNNSENVSYSWSSITFNIPVELHCALAKGKKYRVDILTGVAPGMFLSQSNSTQQASPKYDNFNFITAWGMAGLACEYYLGNSFILRVQPSFELSFSRSQQKRQLEAEGLEVGLVFK